MNRVPRVLKILIGALVLLFIGLAAYGWQATGAELAKAHPPRTLPSPNAYDTYQTALRMLKEPRQIDALIRRPSHPDHPDYGRDEKLEIVQKNAPALKMIRQGFAYDYLEPIQPPVYSLLHKKFKSYRTLARLFILEGQLKAARNDWGSAVGSALDAVEMGSDLPWGGGLMSMLAGVGCQSVGRKPVWNSLVRLNAVQAREAARRMERISLKQLPFVHTLENESQWTRSFMQAHYRNPDLFFRERANLSSEEDEGPEADTEESPTKPTWMGRLLTRLMLRISVRSYSRYTARYMEITRQPYAAHLPRPPVPPDPFTPDLVRVYDKSWFIERNNAAQNGLLTTALAMKAYWNERGSFPDGLEELVPKYLSKIPEDPFSFGADLLYIRERDTYYLYSVGPDGRDDGGQPIDDPGAIKKNKNNPRARYYVNLQSKGDILAGTNF